MTEGYTRGIVLILVCVTWACGPIRAVEAPPEESRPAEDAGIAADPGAVAETPMPASADTPLAPSCDALLARDASLQGKNGIYTIALVGGPTRVHCDMTLDGGGWTLVGRSGTAVPTPPPPFGWTSATGSIDDKTAPYSLGALAVGLTFRAVTVATVDESRAFMFEVPVSFLVPSDSPTRTGTVLHLAGSCAPTGGPSMLANTGATTLTDVFFFRDVDGLDQHRGLAPDGFDLAYSDCERGASLDDEQGVVMVR